MREILFRGKRIDNGEWIEGFLMKISSMPFILVRNPSGTVLWFEVDPETVGQFTGLTDKNGKKIFEGDIVRCWYHRSGNKDLVTVEQVVFHQGAFMAYSTNGKAKWWAHLPHDDGCKPLDKVYLEKVEVIGNIHDNRLEDFENGTD